MILDSKLIVQSGVQPKLWCSREIMSGDEAVAWAAIDSGISFASCYPGTPITDIQEELERSSDSKHIRCVWSINEKVAYESALAIAISGQRAIVSMKQVGLNVAADAFINSCPAGVIGGLVLVLGDDAECHSSPHKQDSRMYRPIAQTLLLEPSDSQEAYSMARDAFQLSERFSLPVMLRLSTRVAHGSSPVMRTTPDEIRREAKWPKAPERFFAIPTLSRKLFLRLDQLQSDLSQTILQSSFTMRVDATATDSVGILTTGVGYRFALEFGPPEAGILKTAGEPFPDSEIRAFLSAHSRVIVLEEGDPVLESRAVALSPPRVEVRGRLSGDLKAVGELQADEIVAIFKGQSPRACQTTNLPNRIPEICKPCGYNKVFAAIKDLSNIATPSDIGCNTMGGLPPYSVLDGVWSMGSSIGVACGLAASGHPRILAIIGDSTFFHAGITPLIEAVHQHYKLTILLLDNGVAAMTGGQPVAHHCHGPIQNAVDLVRLIEAIGVCRCTAFDPHKLGQDGIRDLIENSFSEPGVKVLLYRSQCGLFSPGYFTNAPYSLSSSEKNI